MFYKVVRTFYKILSFLHFYQIDIKNNSRIILLALCCLL